MSEFGLLGWYTNMGIMVYLKNPLDETSVGNSGKHTSIHGRKHETPKNCLMYTVYSTALQMSAIHGSLCQCVFWITCPNVATP